MDEFTLEITALAHGGDGIGRNDGQVCFVPAALPGDIVRVRVSRRTKQALWAEIAEIVTPSPHRQPPPGDHFGPCPMCAWAHFAYPAQAEWKVRIVRETLERIGKISADFAWCEDPALRLGYRTRAEFHGDGEKLGFFAPGTHTIADSGACPLCHPALNTAFEQLHEIGIKGSVTVTVNPEGEEVLVWTRFPQRRLKHRFPLANTPQEDAGRSGFVFDGVPIVNGAFTQSSLYLNRLLMQVVRRYLGKAVSVLDLYCGSGNFSIGLPAGVRVNGIDHNRAAIQAVYALRKGAYFSGDEAEMRKRIRQEDWDTILLDPPRTGAKELMPALAACHARAIVYVSCDPATLARDLKVLTSSGWKVSGASVVDMFPNTPHIETVCRLEQ